VNTWRRKSSGGERAISAAKPHELATDSQAEQSPEGGGERCGAKATWQYRSANDERATVTDEVIRLRAR
jgi:hypothetical protein